MKQIIWQGGANSHLPGIAYYSANVYNNKDRPRIGYQAWVEEQGGKVKIIQGRIYSQWIIEFANDEDYVVFSLKCL